MGLLRALSLASQLPQGPRAPKNHLLNLCCSSNNPLSIHIPNR